MCLCVCLKVQYVFYSEYKTQLFAPFLSESVCPTGPLVCPSVEFGVRMCEQKGSGKGLWTVQEREDKSCDHGAGRRVGATWYSTVCSMFSSPVHHNSQHHHTQQHHKIHGLVQVPSATDPGYVELHTVIYLKTVDSIALFLPCIIAEVCFLCVFPKIQLFIKGLVTVACKSALIFLSGEKKGKR